MFPVFSYFPKTRQSPSLFISETPMWIRCLLLGAYRRRYVVDAGAQVVFVEERRDWRTKARTIPFSDIHCVTYDLEAHENAAYRRGSSETRTQRIEGAMGMSNYVPEYRDQVRHEHFFVGLCLTSGELLPMADFRGTWRRWNGDGVLGQLAKTKETVGSQFEESERYAVALSQMTGKRLSDSWVDPLLQDNWLWVCVNCNHPGLTRSVPCALCNGGMRGLAPGEKHPALEPPAPVPEGFAPPPPMGGPGFS